MQFNVLFTTLLAAAAASAASLPKRQSSVSVDVGQINAAVAALNEASSNLRSLEANLESQLQALNQIQGVGEQLSQAQEKVGDVVQVWGSLAGTLQSASSSYQDADHNASNLFG